MASLCDEKAVAAWDACGRPRQAFEAIVNKHMKDAYYIALGLVAFRFGRTRNQRMLAWLGGIVVFAYIVGLAITKQVFLGL